jgi:isochorismate hydrolase
MISAIRPLNDRHLLEINKLKVAILVLDMQKVYIDPHSKSAIPSMGFIIPNIEKILSAYPGNLTVFTRHLNDNENAKLMSKWWKTLLKQDSSASELVFEKKEALVIEKSQYDAFYDTNLDEILRENLIEQVVIVGAMTNLCCESTARSAFARGYEVFFVADAMATRNYDLHMAALKNAAHGFARVVTTMDVLNAKE